MKKIDGSRINNDLKQKHRDYYKSLPNFYTKNIKEKDLELLFIENPFDFSNLNSPNDEYKYLKKAYWKFVRFNKIKKAKNESDKIIDFRKCYVAFRTPSKAPVRNKTWNGVKLIENFNIGICPYCGMNYITSVNKNNGKVKTTASLDHYLPKNKYPFLAMNIYNLIPSCRNCNSVFKHQEENPIIYPYYDELENFITFNIKNIDTIIDMVINNNNMSIPVNIEILPNILQDKNTKERLKDHIKILALEQRYNNFQNIAKSLIRKRHLYNKSYLEKIGNLGIYSKDILESFLVKQDTISEDEVFSKFKRDIWNQLNNYYCH